MSGKPISRGAYLLVTCLSRPGQSAASSTRSGIESDHVRLVYTYNLHPGA